MGPELLKPIAETALFYPCCGKDLLLPIELFASVVSDFYFVDIRIPARPSLDCVANIMNTERRPQGDLITDTFLHNASGHEFRLHRWKCRGGDVIAEMPKLGVFFFRGDNPEAGEGSSGILWLGGELFSQILTLLVPGGIVVTDGSNCDPSGPTHLSDFYHNGQIQDRAMKKAEPFEYAGRMFTCVDYVGEKYGPTLVWWVS